MLDGGGRVSNGRRILAVDPGTSTGWVAARLEPGELAGGGPAVRAAARDGRVQVGEAHAGLGCVWDRFGEREITVEMFKWLIWADVLIMEDFVLRRSEKSRSLLSPVRVAERLVSEYTRSHMHSDPEWFAQIVVWQSPSDISIYKDEMLKGWDIWIPGKGGHKRDALRHLLLWMASQS